MAVTILYNHTNTTTSSLAFIVVPNLWAPGIRFMEDNFFTGSKGRDGFRMIQAHYIY